MLIEAVIDDLKSIYPSAMKERRSCDEYLKENHTQAWSDILSLSRIDLYNNIAMYLARAFNNNELPFMFCDAVVNGMVALIVKVPDLKEMPEPFWSIFLASDNGEFYHDGNRDEDPVEAHTRPMLAKIIAGSGAQPQATG